ncbi:MAG: co-chaperone GroES [bacterium]|nr:co-chaperone GroES [bacterium]
MNKTGIRPVEYKVLIKVDEIEDRSVGGILLPETSLEREQYAHDRGVVVDCGGLAFSDWKGRLPLVGDKVVFNKYAGSIIQHRPTERKLDRYRLCNDKDICAILEEEDGN